MSDGEFRLFKENWDKCIKCDPCRNKYVMEMKDKSIREMTMNEYDYYSSNFWSCDSVNPCELKQFIEIKDKTEMQMTNNELDFYEKCKDECKSFEYKRSTKHKIKKSIFISGMILLFISAMGFMYYDATRPRGW
jgi:hypothetical protein